MSGGAGRWLDREAPEGFGSAPTDGNMREPEGRKMLGFALTNASEGLEEIPKWPGAMSDPRGEIREDRNRAKTTDTRARGKLVFLVLT